MVDGSLLGTSHKFASEDFAVSEHPEYFMVFVADYLNVLRKRYAKYYKAKDEKKRRATLEKAILFLSYLNINFKAGFMPED